MENGHVQTLLRLQDGNKTDLASPDYKAIPLPPLIKIANTVPAVGYSATTNTNQNNSEPSSSVTPIHLNSPQADAMPSTIETESPPTTDNIPILQVPQYRPTVISLNTHIPVNTSSAHSQDEYEPIQVPEKAVMEDQTPSPPRPLVPPPEGERPERMRDWLVRIINSGRIPGLRWLDDEKAIFRVPWIHAKKRDYNQERDAALFREWAIHSGKYGDGSDVTTWKINFRCALNGLKDIIERRDLEEPDCRVYQMLPCSSTGRRRKRRRVFYPTDAAFYQGSEVRPRIDHASPVTTPTYPLTPTTAPGTPIQVLPIVTAGMQVRLPLVASPTTPHTMPTITSPFGILQSIRPTLFHPHPLHPSTMATAFPAHFPMVTKRKSLSPPLSRDGSGSQPPTPRTPLSPQQQSPRVLSPHGSTRAIELITFPPPSHAPHSTHQLPHVLPSPLRTGPVFCPPQEMCNSPTAIVVRVLYGSITVHMETVDCTGGTRIFYGPLHCRDVLPPEQEERLFGPLKAHQIQLTPRHPAPIAKEMFGTIKRGLIIEVFYTPHFCCFCSLLKITHT
jgi:hypothetical protein